jgi:mono/diheme cytochrome c family protein
MGVYSLIYVRWIIPALLMLLISAGGRTSAAPVTSAPNSQRGQELAAQLCSNCHLVGTVEQQHANADVPSFHEIANKEGQSAGAIMVHIMLPKHPMPTIPLTKSELADLAAYILSLRDAE